MTRINVIDPKNLTDQHLMAEYRELPMVGASLRRSLKAGIKNIPRRYLLGTGHVSYFYDKGLFLRRRYDMLVNELEVRGYQLSERTLHFDVFTEKLYNDWIPNEEDLIVNANRIREKLNMKMSWYRYYGKRITEIDNEMLFNPNLMGV